MTWDCLQTPHVIAYKHEKHSCQWLVPIQLGVGVVELTRVRAKYNVGQIFCQPFNSMEWFHAIEWMTCQPSIKWNGFQAITSLTNHPCYYYLHISKLIQGCIFHFLTGRPCNCLSFFPLVHCEDNLARIRFVTTLPSLVFTEEWRE